MDTTTRPEPAPAAPTVPAADLVPLQFVPYDELAGRPNVIVDGSATDGTVLCLSHWPGTPTPVEFQADLSAQMAFRYLRRFDRHGGAALVSNNHFDQDGLVSVFALTNPEVALVHEELLIDVAAAGDFGTYRFRDAARASMVISAYTEPDRSPLAEEIAAADDPTGPLYDALLPRLVELATDPTRYEALWADEDAVLTASERCVADEVEVTEAPDLDLAVFEVPIDAPDAGGHRFGGMWSAGLHPMALNNVTERLTLLVRRGRHYELVCRYEGWVQLRSRPLRPRVDLAPLADRLNAMESGGARWTATGPGNLLAGLSTDEDAESSIEPSRFRALVEEHLATAPPAWNPYAEP